MKDMRGHLEKLRIEAAECRLISQLTTDKKKKELFANLATHHEVLAHELERALTTVPWERR